MFHSKVLSLYFFELAAAAYFISILRCGSDYKLGLSWFEGGFSGLKISSVISKVPLEDNVWNILSVPCVFSFKAMPLFLHVTVPIIKPLRWRLYSVNPRQLLWLFETALTKVLRCLVELLCLDPLIFHSTQQWIPSDPNYTSIIKWSYPLIKPPQWTHFFFIYVILLPTPQHKSFNNPYSTHSSVKMELVVFPKLI